jgi:hypothetical protein
VHVPDADIVPHAPQFAADEVTFVSQPFASFASQLAKPARHLKPQPLAQVETAFAGGAHTTPHAPQLFTSALRSRHVAPPQSCCGNGHRHIPDEHTRPPPQVVPHAPQFIGSLAVSTHAAPQRVSPARH